jgi:hypothetical protein
MIRSFVQRCLLPILAAFAFLSPIPSQAFIQGRYTSPPPALSVPVLPTAANGPDLPSFGAISEGELGVWKSCRNDPVSFNDPMGLRVSETDTCGFFPSGYVSYLESDAPLVSLDAWEHLSVGAANVFNLAGNTVYGGMDLLGKAGEKADDISIYFTGMNSAELYMNVQAAGPLPPVRIATALPYAVSRSGTALRSIVAFLTHEKCAASGYADDFARWWTRPRPLGATGGYVDSCAQSSQSIFWAGRWKGQISLNEKAAREFAAATGGTVLDMTPAGRTLRLSLDTTKMTIPEIRAAWSQLSLEYARSAVGEVHAFTGGAAIDSVWKTVELPALLKNPKVKKIIIHDATRPESVRIIYPQ